MIGLFLMISFLTIVAAVIFVINARDEGRGVETAIYFSILCYLAIKI